MKRETITISVPPAMKKYIMARGSSEFDSVSRYIRDLVRRDRFIQGEVKRIRNMAGVKGRDTRGAARR